MAPPLEKHIERKAVEAAKRLGVIGLKMNTLSRRGFPDRQFLIPGGRPLFIEFKRPGGGLTALQEKAILTLEKLGYAVKVYDSARSAEEEVARMVKQSETVWVFSTAQLGEDTWALFNHRTMRFVPDPKIGARLYPSLEDAVAAAVKMADKLDYAELLKLRAAGEV